MPAKIGFPRTLFYFLYYPFWHTYFTELGFEMVVSNPTSKSSLDLGVQETVNDACLPIKLYHGHVAELKDHVDILFLPRMVSVRKELGETFCPKFLGLPDMIKNSLDNLPPIIDDNIDLRKGNFALWKLCYKIARNQQKSSLAAWRAYSKANQVQAQFIQTMTQGIPAQDAIDVVLTGKPYQPAVRPIPDINLAIIGYPYVIYDSFVNAGLLSKMAEMGIKPWMVETILPERLDYQAKYFPKNLFWYFSNRAIRGTMYYLKEHKVDGIIHVTAFGCGPDAMVDKLMELECKSHKVPFLTLSLDEHTGEAGVMTRIEAFVDMLRLRRVSNENIFSHHG